MARNSCLALLKASILGGLDLPASKAPPNAAPRPLPTLYLIGDSTLKNRLA